MTMKTTLWLLMFMACTSYAQHHTHANTSPYTHLQSRSIKALSAEDTTKLLQGQGMGLALAAELNGYAGPLHVLELANTLGLTEWQHKKTQQLLNEHKAQARELGQRIVEEEQALDNLFSSGQATPETVEKHTRAIGMLQGALRNAHLQTHLTQHALLTSQQQMHYQQLRGYSNIQTPKVQP